MHIINHRILIVNIVYRIKAQNIIYFKEPYKPVVQKVKNYQVIK